MGADIPFFWKPGPKKERKGVTGLASDQPRRLNWPPATKMPTARTAPPSAPSSDCRYVEVPPFLDTYIAVRMTGSEKRAKTGERPTRLGSCLSMEEPNGNSRS